MSCVDLMYQPYASYFQYQRASLATPSDPLKKYGRLHDVADSGLYGSGLTHGGHSVGSPASPGALGHSLSVKEEASLEKRPTNTQYLSANCVLLTYFSGDVESHVDEHFSRALSVPSSFSADNQGTKPIMSHWKDSSPMSQRNFPASFWNSNYQATPHPDLSALGAESYMTASSLHSVPGLHAQDPWRYPLTSQAHSYTHPSVHDLAYPAMASSSRYSHHYGSLLPTAGRLGSMSSQCELAKHAESWGSRYPGADPLSASGSLAAAHDSHLHTGLPGAGGIESVSTLQESSTKDSMYWF